MNEFKLPKEAFVNTFIAKTKFYEKATVSSKLQKEFVDTIQKITWKYKLAEGTIGVAKTERVTEIQIFELELKEQAIPKNVLKIIDKTIPYQILYRFIYGDNVAYGITLKEDTCVEIYYFSEWNQPMSFDFTGIDLEKVYHKLVKAFVREEVQNEGSFSDIIEADSAIKALEAEIVSLEAKINKEKQFNRQVEIHKVLLEKKADLRAILDDVR
ncbi:MAG TPA: DUF4391 domain-containing protein [Treponemataceae bacterium]|nr:DUF4391 domain-containing protein [Treponemataceae bacterium]